MEKRPSKKQTEVLNYIDEFIKQNGFGPSYREVMKALEYKSVSTVAAHVNELIARGYLQKRDNSARSLQVMTPGVDNAAPKIMSTHLDWLRREISKREVNTELVEEVKILKAALALLDQSEEK